MYVKLLMGQEIRESWLTFMEAAEGISTSRQVYLRTWRNPDPRNNIPWLQVCAIHEPDQKFRIWEWEILIGQSYWVALRKIIARAYGRGLEFAP